MAPIRHHLYFSSHSTQHNFFEKKLCCTHICPQQIKKLCCEKKHNTFFSKNIVMWTDVCTTQSFQKNVL